MIQVKNNKSESDVWCGMEILPTAYYTIEQFELARWQNSSKVLIDISTGDLVVNNGTSDILDVASAINYLKGLDSEPRDADGAKVQRIKAAKVGWKAQFHAIRISTATANGVHNKSKSGSDLGFCVYTMYDAQNAVTADPATCVKTVVTWEPTHDMEIVGGRLFQKTSPNQDVWLYVTAAAHIPSQYGGSVEFLQGGMNLSDVSDGGEVDFDGRASKFIAYDSVNHSGRFEILINHPVNFQHSFSIVFELFRP